MSDNVKRRITLRQKVYGRDVQEREDYERFDVSLIAAPIVGAGGFSVRLVNMRDADGFEPGRYVRVTIEVLKTEAEMRAEREAQNAVGR